MGTNGDMAQLAGRCAKILGEPGCRSQGFRSLECLPFLSSSHCTLLKAALTPSLPDSGMEPNDTVFVRAP